MNRPRRHSVRSLTAAFTATALLGAGAVLAPPAQAAGDWRTALAAVADLPAQGSSLDLRNTAATALQALDADAASGLRDDAGRYIDGTRYIDRVASAAVLDEDKRLATDLQSALNSDTLPAASGVMALSRVLGAHTQSARVLLADARLASVGSPKDEVGFRQAAAAIDKAVEQWRKGQPVAVLSHLEQSVRQSTDVLVANGMAAYDLTRDTDGDSLPDLLELRAGSSPRRADTDGDGLLDVFEVLRTNPVHRPDVADTDGNGRGDAFEDVDGDGLTALQEQALGTDPLQADEDRDGLDDAVETGSAPSNPRKADSDDDGLSDAAERRVSLDPNNPDTDGDGIGDADEVTTGTVVRGPVRAVLTGTGDLTSSFEAVAMTRGPAVAPGTGRVGQAYDLSLADEVEGGLRQAVVTLPFDPSAVGEEEDLRVFTYDPSAGAWLPVPGEHPVDRAAGAVTVTLEHFSIYAVFSVPQWGATFTGLGGTCAPGSGTGETVFADVAFVLDASGSMSSNDPNRLRQQASKNFVDAFIDGDKGAVVSFAFGAALLQGLTGDKTALKAAIDRVGAGGGTNIGAGVTVGLNALAQDTDPAVAKIMILLTDGVGSYSESLTTKAGNERVTIFTVGLGSGVDEGLLRRIAAGTGGQYYPVRSAADLPTVFREIEQDSGDDGRDTDGDGLSDCDEELGVLDGNSGQRLTSDPRTADTDGDGLPDGTELARRPLNDLERLLLGGLGAAAPASVLTAISDPRKPDSDDDGRDDLSELDEGSDPRDPDSDGDGLDDDTEEQEGTDPVDRDTDGDGYTDAFEVQRIDQDFDPLTPTVVQGRVSYLRDFTVGATCGDFFGFCRIESVAWLAGNLVSGFVVFGDIRDGISSLFRGDLVGIGLAAGGLIPLAGDAVKGLDSISSFLRKLEAGGPKSQAVVRFAMSLDELPTAAKIKVLEEYAGSLSRIRGSGISDDALIALARRTDVRRLEASLAGARGVDSGGGSFRRWQDAERELRSRTGSQATEQPFPVNPARPNDMKGGRKIDAWNPMTRIGRESKNGYVGGRRVKATLEQITKEERLLDMGRVDGIEWHFFPSSRSGTIGADPAIIKALQDAKIPYFFHLP